MVLRVSSPTHGSTRGGGGERCRVLLAVFYHEVGHEGVLEGVGRGDDHDVLGDPHGSKAPDV